MVCWPIDYTGCECDALEGLTPEDKTRVEALAVEVLDGLTGGKFGACPVTIRPCMEACGRENIYPILGGLGFLPVNIGGEWFNLTCGCAKRCQCDVTGAQVIVLPGKVAGVDSVTIDGVELAPTEYRLNYGNRLFRVGDVWPMSQDLTKPSSEPGTFAVTYRRGVDVPTGGKIAAGLLACEFAKQLCGQECGLTPTMSSVTRQGVTFALETGADRTGVPLVDKWIDAATKIKPRTVLGRCETKGLFENV